MALRLVERALLIALAVTMIRANYTWRGVWLVLRRRHAMLGGERTWRVLLRDPDRVYSLYRGLAEGVFS